MTDARRDLLLGMLWVFLIGMAVANRQWLIAAGGLIVSLFILRPIWHIAARRIELLRRVVEHAEDDPSARRARGSTRNNGGLSSKHRRSEDT